MAKFPSAMLRWQHDRHLQHAVELPITERQAERMELGLRSECWRFLKRAGFAALSGQKSCFFPKSSPYKDGACTCFDANSFPSKQRQYGKQKLETRGLLRRFLQYFLALAARGQHLVKCRLLAQILQQRIIEQSRVRTVILLYGGLQ